MKQKTIIYGVDGMMEYQAIIKVGKARMKIAFTNGSSNEAGRTPATFTTSNIFTQLAIENSAEFKAGLIRKVHVVEGSEDVYIESEHVEKAGAAESAVSDEANKPNEADNADGDAEDGGKADAAAETMTPKEFACVDDARDFFAEQYGVQKSKLRTQADNIAFGKAHGYEVTFSK